MIPTDLHLGVDESKVNSCKSVGRHKWHIVLRLPAVRLHHSLQPLVERDDRSRYRAAVLKVLELAAEDQRILAQMTEDPAQVLNKFDLTDEERAALASGDIRFIEETVGKLTQNQKT